MTSQQHSSQSALKQWRRALRSDLIARRMAVERADRKAWDAAIEHTLYTVLMASGAGVVALYWPFRGEFNCRALMQRLVAADVGVALPVVAERNRPLVFHRWTPATAMTHGVYGIPIPQTGQPVRPDAVVAPLVGFDAAGYRLGNGGGYYDRTLAVFEPAPFTVGVGYELSRLETIRPQAYDVALQRIVTEAGLHVPTTQKPTHR